MSHLGHRRYLCIQFLPPNYKRLDILADSTIPASECAEDSIIKFTSLIRARDYIAPLVIGPVE